MDPQITLTNLLAYLRDGELIEAQYALDNLMAWHTRRGFVPDLKAALDTLLADVED